MNKIILIFLVIVLFFSDISAQELQEKNNKIDSLFTLINKVTPAKRSEIFDSKLLKFKKITIDENDLEKAKELMYYAYAHAPIELRKKQHELYVEWKKVGPEELKPNERRKIVEEAIAEKYGKDYLGFLKTPYFMRVKILDITRTIYPTDKKIRGQISQFNLKVKITDILKGKEYYTKDDMITIIYLPIWFENGNISPPKFKINEEYIVPLNHWYNSDAFELDMHGLNTLFQVKNNEVYCPLISTTEIVKSWDDFKKEFELKYLMDSKE